MKTYSMKRDEIAKKLGIEPSFLASQALLVQAQTCLDRQGNLEGFEEFRTWQEGVLRPAFENGS